MDSQSSVEEDFKKKIYRLTSQIPKGKVSTYRILAAAAGRPRAARAVGRILAVNPTPIIVPCHRVVYFDGRLGGYSGGEGVKTKIRLLRDEGVDVIEDRIQQFNKYLFKDFR